MKESSALTGFTPRELEIIELRVRGNKPASIAAMKGISTQAVYRTLSKAYQKAGCANGAQFVQWAVANGIVKLPAAIDVDTPGPSEGE